MHTTLVGVFVNPRDAQTAYWTLASAGIDRGDIRMRREKTAQSRREPHGRAGLRRASGSVGRWLSGLLGTEQDEVRAAEAARQGHVVVTVVFGDENRVEELSALLETCGAVDIDERVEQWQGDLGMPPSRGRRSAAHDDGSATSAFGAFDRRIGF